MGVAEASKALIEAGNGLEIWRGHHEHDGLMRSWDPISEEISFGWFQLGIQLFIFSSNI